MVLRVHKHNVRWVLWAVGAILIVAIGVVLYVMSQRNMPQKTATHTVKQDLVAPVTPVAIQSTIGFFGNVYWGRDINTTARASDLGVAFPFSRLNEFDRDSYDAWVTGLECPSVPRVNLTAAQEQATLTFNCSPDYLPEAAKWFTAVTLANNHTDNQGVDGFAATKAQLEQHGIQYFGHYDPNALDDICDVIRISARIVMSDKSEKPAALPIALCGYHGVFRIPSDASLAVMRRYSEVMPVVAMPHAGAEYQASPDQMKTTLYRKMIDNGADVVIGDHPHWVQTTESYNGHLIVYSMGNFIFDQYRSPEVRRSAGIKLALRADAQASEIEQWVQIAESCVAYRDNCLERAEELSLERLPFDFTFGVIPTSSDGKIAHPASEEETRGIMDRLRWNETASQLQLPYRAE